MCTAKRRHGGGAATAGGGAGGSAAGRRKQPRCYDRVVLPALEELALNSDLASTIIDVAGLPVPDTHTGRSLASLVRGEDVSDWRTDFLCEFLAVPATIPRWEGVRHTDWVYARYYVNGANEPPFEFLHDLENDPDQRINLALKLKDSDAMKQIRAHCDELIAEAGPAMKDVGEDQRASRKKKQRTPRTRK